MPNWCHNTLTVSGDPPLVAEFIQKVGIDEAGNATPLSFHPHVPRPAEAEEDWYAWNVEHWGTKWDACFGPPGAAIQLTEAPELLAGDWAPVDGGMQVCFDTAWAPPTAWLARVGELEPQLRFVMRFGEPGEGFAGEVQVHGSERTERELEVEDALEEGQMWF